MCTLWFVTFMWSPISCLTVFTRLISFTISSSFEWSLFLISIDLSLKSLSNFFVYCCGHRVSYNWVFLSLRQCCYYPLHWLVFLHVTTIFGQPLFPHLYLIYDLFFSKRYNTYFFLWWLTHILGKFGSWYFRTQNFDYIVKTK